MRRFRFLAITVAVAAFVAAGQSTTSARDIPRESVARAREIERIRSHFDSVLAELAAADIGWLSSTQRANRAQLLVTLQSYRDAGVFPRNYDFAVPTPYFIDRKTGTLCAVAHLMSAAGRRDLVDRVARANNNVRVAELRGDAEFQAWLSTSGITLEEAARIQVPYAPGEGSWGLSESTSPVYGIASTVASSGALVATLVNTTLNRRGNSRLGNALGFAAGAAALGVGAAGLAEPMTPRVLMAANAVLGAASIGFSARGMVRRQHAIAARRAAARSAAVSIGPQVSPEGKAVLGLAIQF